MLVTQVCTTVLHSISCCPTSHQSDDQYNSMLHVSYCYTRVRSMNNLWLHCVWCVCVCVCVCVCGCGCTCKYLHFLYFCMLIPVASSACTTAPGPSEWFIDYSYYSPRYKIMITWYIVWKISVYTIVMIKFKLLSEHLLNCMCKCIYSQPFTIRTHLAYFYTTSISYLHSVQLV